MNAPMKIKHNNIQRALRGAYGVFVVSEEPFEDLEGLFMNPEKKLVVFFGKEAFEFDSVATITSRIHSGLKSFLHGKVERADAEKEEERDDDA